MVAGAGGAGKEGALDEAPTPSMLADAVIGVAVMVAIVAASRTPGGPAVIKDGA